MTFTQNFDIENIVQDIEDEIYKHNFCKLYNGLILKSYLQIYCFLSIFREEGEGRKKQDEATGRLKVCSEDGYRCVQRMVTDMFMDSNRCVQRMVTGLFMDSNRYVQRKVTGMFMDSYSCVQRKVTGMYTG